MSLARTQFLSLTTKTITTALGLVQSFIIIRLLSPAEFGLVGLVMSIGGVIGVSQHLGIVDGAIREIAVLKDKRTIGKVFWVSHLVRQAVTIPLSLALVAMAGYIAVHVYNKPEIIPYIRLFAIVLILQGLQDVLGATLTGMKRFTTLYTVQIITAAINIVVFGYLIWTLGTIGFFYAVIITTAIMVATFITVVARELRGSLSIPTWSNARAFAARIMKIGAYMYLSRIAFVVWQRLPLLLLGGVLAADELGFLNISLTFGTRLTIIAMAISEVNLSWMSSLYAHERDKFTLVATRNMQRVMALMAALTLAPLYFAPEIITIVKPEYLPATPLIYIMTVAFFLYSLVDIGTNSVFVPADRTRLRASVYAVLVAIPAAIIGLLAIYSPDAKAATIAALSGAIASYAAMVWLSKRRLGINLLSRPLALILVIVFASLLWLLAGPTLPWRASVFAVLAIAALAEMYKRKLRSGEAGLLPYGASAATMRIICFAGAPYNQNSWTNRQHMMSRVAKSHPVLYVEPRIWLPRYLIQNWRQPRNIIRLLTRIIWYDRADTNLFIKSQWNLIPYSREIKVIAAINHALNCWNVMMTARLLGFTPPKTTLRYSLPVTRYWLWLYDTEAAEYLRAFPHAHILYDCVDDHAAQAGADRNSARVRAEEANILARANLVTVTSERLLALKKNANANVHLVLNAGDITLFQRADAVAPLRGIPRPIFGLVGALDDYKVDFQLLFETATSHRDWQFVMIGEPIVNKRLRTVAELSELPNVHWLGSVPRHHVPAYVHAFDVCLIPYQSSRYNTASFPLKFWEFMATGKPIVVTGLPELERYQPLVAFARNIDEFAARCRDALNADPSAVAKRIALAQDHSWEQRVEAVLKLLETSSQKT